MRFLERIRTALGLARDAQPCGCKPLRGSLPPRHAPAPPPAPPRSFRSFPALDEGFEAVVVVGQGLGEGEELGDGVGGAGKVHLDPIAADRDAGRQAGEPALEGVGGDRDADPGAAGLAERAQHPVAAGGFVPEGALCWICRSWRRSAGRGRVRMEPVRSAPKARISVAARARETPKSCSRSRRVSSGRSSASSYWMASGMARSHRGRAGTLGTGQRIVGVSVGRMTRRHGLRDVRRRSSRMQAGRRQWVSVT